MIAPISFNKNIPINDMLSTTQQQEGFKRIRYCISTKGFCVITGAPGAGKSTLIRSIDSSLDKSKFLLCYINEKDLTPKTLYARLLQALSIKPPNYIDNMKKQFKDAVINLHASQERLLVIVIDNAHELPEATFSEFRYLLCFEIDSMSLFPLILVGHPDLWDTLKLRKLKPLYQCINLHYQMSSLDLSQTKDYIIHQLKLSNMANCFPDDVIKRIYHSSHGIPRIINNICRHCLIDMEANKLEIADNNVLDKVFNEFQY